MTPEQERHAQDKAFYEAVIAKERAAHAERERALEYFAWAYDMWAQHPEKFGPLFDALTDQLLRARAALRKAGAMTER